VSCTQGSDPCHASSGHCGAGGACEFDFSPNTTPCGGDDISCTSDHCDGAGICVHDVTCSGSQPFCCTCMNNDVRYSSCKAGGAACDNAVPGICAGECVQACRF
jgi:hypothetical protein